MAAHDPGARTTLSRDAARKRWDKVPDRAAFHRKFTTDDARRAYFAELGRRSAAARRARKAQAHNG